MKQKIESHVEEDVVARLDEFAELMGYSRSKAVAMMINNYLDVIDKWGEDDQKLFDLAMERYKRKLISEIESELAN